MIGGAIERCTEHGLVLGPDGMCVLCRSSARSSLNRRVWLGIGAVLLLSTACAAAGWVWKDAHAREREQLAAMVPATAVHPWLDPPFATPTSEPVAQGTRRFHFPSREGSPQQASPQPPPDPVPVAAASADVRDPSRDRAKQAQAAMQDVSVVIYTADWCGACQQAKQWLRQHDIRFDDRNIETQPSAAAEMKRLNPSGKIPTMQIDGAVITGFSPGSLQAAIRKAAEARAARSN